MVQFSIRETPLHDAPPCSLTYPILPLGFSSTFFPDKWYQRNNKYYFMSPIYNYSHATSFFLKWKTSQINTLSHLNSAHCIMPRGVQGCHITPATSRANRNEQKTGSASKLQLRLGSWNERHSTTPRENLHLAQGPQVEHHFSAAWCTGSTASPRHRTLRWGTPWGCV